MPTLVFNAIIADDVHNFNMATYPLAHDPAAGTVGGAVNFFVHNSLFAGGFWVARGFLAFDTFTLGLLAAITAAKISLVRTCFVHETLIHTPQGKIPIEKLKMGDKVLSMNLATKEMESQIITNIIRGAATTIRVSTTDSLAECSPAHPFMVLSKGWVKAEDLTTEDFLVSDHSKAKITALDYTHRVTPVIDLSISKNNNYFVGEGMFLVHNKTETDLGQATIHVVEGLFGAALVPADFGNHIGCIVSGGSIADAALAGGYCDINLNATGISWINKTGISKFCLRNFGDINNLLPTGLNNKNIDGLADPLTIPLLTVDYNLLPPAPAKATVVTLPATGVT